MNDQISDLASRDEIQRDLEIVDYVAGRMQPDARQRFEQRLATDSGLAAQVAEERELSGSLRDAIPTHTPSADGFERLRAQLNEAPSRSSQWQVWAMAASVVGAFVIVALLAVPRADFETLSNDGALPVSDVSRYRVVFSADSDAETQAAAASYFGFRIVSGPGTGGAYVVETESPVSRDTLSDWRKDPRIALAEPIVYEPAR